MPLLIDVISADHSTQLNAAESVDVVQVTVTAADFLENVCPILCVIAVGANT